MRRKLNCLYNGVYPRRKIRQIESNAKCRHPKKLTCKGTLWLVFICLRPPPLLSFCLGGLAILLVLILGRYRVLNSCRICMVSNKIPYPPTPYTLYSVYSNTVYGTYSHREGERRVEPKRRLEGQLSPVYKLRLTPSAESFCRSIF